MIKRIISLLLAFSLISVPVWAQETEYYQEEATRLPYSVALRGAIRNLPAITSMDDSIEDLTEMRDDLRAILDLRRTTGTLTREEERRLQRQIADLGASVNTMRASQEIIRTSTEFLMRSSITQINNTRIDIQLLEATLEHESANFEIARQRFAAGQISESELNALELLLERREADMASLRVSLDIEIQNLNRILQRPVTSNYYIYFDRELMELPENLDAHVRRYAPREPNVRQMEIALNRAQAAVNDEHDLASPQRAERERARNQAERQLNATLRSVETAMRNQYNALTMLRHNIQSLEIELQRVQAVHEAALLNYQQGMVTRFDVEAAELAILRVELSIEQNLNTFWNSQFLFENPFLLLQ